MKIPHVVFTYSDVYDLTLQRKPYTDKGLMKGWRFSQKVQKRWNKVERKTLGAMSRVSGLKWQEDKIDCFLVTKSKHYHAFSYPLTLTMWNNISWMFFILIHELGHRLKVQNSKNLKPLRKSGLKSYSKETPNVRVHLAVMAIEFLTIKKLYGKKHAIACMETYRKYK